MTNKNYYHGDYVAFKPNDSNESRVNEKHDISFRDNRKIVYQKHHRVTLGRAVRHPGSAKKIEVTSVKFEQDNQIVLSHIGLEIVL